jgi:HD-GYP domain-containing protein (c-di-GMP phosphodiesterase class II)
MLTTRIYRAARPASEALEELRQGSGSQFCPRCVGSLERLLQGDELDQSSAPAALVAAAS